MFTCWDNIFPLSYFCGRNQRKKIPGKVFHFLSFADAFQYLEEDLNLKGETLLMPGFYCEHTVFKYQKNLKVLFCEIDETLFDIDYQDFLNKLRKYKPRVLIIYNFFGKNSLLYREKEWLEYISPDTVIISDLAHSLLYNHPITFFSSHHFHIDSARKCTPCMVSNLVTPPDYRFDKRKVRRCTFYKYRLRALFMLKNCLLILAYLTRSKRLLQSGVNLFLKHDSLIGESVHPTFAFWGDSFLFKHISPSKICLHKADLYRAYDREFKKYPLPEVTHFSIPKKEQENLCFYFIAVPEDRVKPLCRYAFERGIVIDQLWNVKSIPGLPEGLKKWGSQIVVLPYTNLTPVSSVPTICKIIADFFRVPC